MKQHSHITVNYYWCCLPFIITFWYDSVLYVCNYNSKYITLLSVNTFHISVVCVLTCDNTPSSSIFRTHFSVTETLSSTWGHFTKCTAVR